MKSRAAGNSDHDLLIVLNTKMDSLSTDVKDLKDGTQRRLDTLENGKVGREDFETFKQDHEARMRKIERWGAVIAGALAVLNFLAPTIRTKLFGG